MRLEISAGSLRSERRSLRLPSSQSLKRRSQSRKRLFSKKSTKRRSRGSWTAHQAAPRLRPHHRQGRGVLRTHQGGGAQSSECGGLQAGPPGIWAGTRQPGHFDQGCQLTVVRCPNTIFEAKQEGSVSHHKPRRRTLPKRSKGGNGTQI